MKLGLANQQVISNRRWGRAFLWLLGLWAALFLFSCASPGATSGGGVPTNVASLPVTNTPAVAAVAIAPSLESGLIPDATASPAAMSDPKPTSVLVTTTGLSSTTPLSTPVPTSGALQEGPTVYSYRIVNAYPHDPSAFTQGLVYEDGVLYEGTGLWGQSTLRKVDLETGDVLKPYALPDQYFGEGITIWGDKIVQLTWKSGVGFVYDRNSFEALDTFDYVTEGWGITHDGTNLIMSDGTATLHFWDPETFEEIKQVQVHDERGPVIRLNELEYIQGQVYANVWQTDLIAIIDPENGQVTGWVNLNGLLPAEDLQQAVDVLNGIAYDADGDRLFVTGKWWPKLFEIVLLPLP